MIPRIITDASITFIARGKPWVLSDDHANFKAVRDLLVANSDDEDGLIRLTDVSMAVEDFSLGRAQITDEGVFLDGQRLPDKWLEKAAAQPELAKVLAVRPGDRVRIEGDEDAPDGVYVVGDVDNADADSRIFVEDEEGFFGYVADTSIKEIVR